MSTSPNLMYAILPWIHRGYYPGISGLSEASNGTVQIGTATISKNFQDAQFSNDAASCYALAYEWNGETIISYPGGDTNLELLLTDYPISVNDDCDEALIHSLKLIPGTRILS
ncbi:MAG: hypothetical protein NPIRA06_06700 [Nitrospirales bacterium]|nr:MAG: hypothetical protein NPIRA06_06700 [Nitrospirales bacterium]